MQKILLGLKSRTVWVIVGMMLINGVSSITHLLPPGWLPYVNGLLGLAAILFRVNPRAS